LKVTGWKRGEGAFEKYMGSLEMASADGKIAVNMSGFPLKLRAEITANLTGEVTTYAVAAGVEPDGTPMWIEHEAHPGDCEVNIGSIIEVKYNEKILARNTETWSLFLPRFEKVRTDKTVANKFEEIK
jgi:ATP-dependent DNA ligase